MHLSYSVSAYKGKKYKSYAIAESYRDGKKVRKRPIWKIGKLTDRQANQIRLICKIVSSEDEVITRLKDIVVKESKPYLDIAVVNELWNQWELDKAFNHEITNSKLSTPLIAKLLTINRCIAPCSHYSIPVWANKTSLSDVLKIDLSGLNDDKIYYELDKIYKNKISIENHLFKLTYDKNPESYKFIDYDLTTTYFVGYKCNLSAFGKGKIECHGRRQILLGVLINNEGYPFKWDVFPGNTAEVKTLRRNINACKCRFKLNDTNVTIVFDRGIISNDNADLIDDAKMKYISALDRNQISSCGISLEAFKSISEKGDKNKLKPKDFKKYDEELYFHDSGVIGNKRFITGFNPTLFKEDRKNRDEKIAFWDAYLKKENKKLENAQKDRKFDATKNRITNELKRLKINKYYKPVTLHPITIKKTLKNGTKKFVKSFRVEVQKKEESIKSDKLLDGICVFITNHKERQGRGYKVKPHTIIAAYRNKTKIEDVFKNIKSFLKIRPFYVNSDKHVKAVYTICILGYFINKYLANQRKALGEKDFLNSEELYAPFKNIDYVTLKDSKSNKINKKSVEIPKNTQRLLENIGIPNIVLGQQNCSGTKSVVAESRAVTN